MPCWFSQQWWCCLPLLHPPDTHMFHIIRVPLAFPVRPRMMETDVLSLTAHILGGITFTKFKSSQTTKLFATAVHLPIEALSHSMPVWVFVYVSCLRKLNSIEWSNVRNFYAVCFFLSFHSDREVSFRLVHVCEICIYNRKMLMQSQYCESITRPTLYISSQYETSVVALC